MVADHINSMQCASVHKLINAQANKPHTHKHTHIHTHMETDTWRHMQSQPEMREPKIAQYPTKESG